jgi:hypothetical protein
MPKSRKLSNQWQDYRRRVRWQLVALVAGVVVGATFIVLGRDTAGWRAVGTIAASIWVPCIFITTMRLQFFPCPACGKSFFVSRLGIHSPTGLVRQCKHCGMAKWEQ